MSSIRLLRRVILLRWGVEGKCLTLWTEDSSAECVVIVDPHPRSVYFKVTSVGIETDYSFLAINDEMLRADIISATVMAAADVQITE